ncbi:MAG: TolC family protein [Pyrinomonadaceae bacterium]|nr:TolC family protein [Pyrinomonadaceae bacterium]
MILAVLHWFRSFGLALLVGVALLFVATAEAQNKKPKVTIKPANELAQLREKFINATKEYKTSLAKLLDIYERNVTKAEEKLAQSQSLYSEGLISKVQLAEAETAVTEAKAKVNEARTQMTNADTQIANTLVEAQAEAQLAKMPLRKGGLLRTTSYIRYGGAAAWGLSEAWKVQRFFHDSFKMELPVAVFGQGAIHDRWRLDHRNAMDVSLHPDGPEGQLLMNYLRANGIPFLAFRSAIPGTATGPHIHIGRPSHRF